MNKQPYRICAVLAVFLIAASIGAVSVASVEQFAAQSQAMLFIETALPVDLSKYQVTFVKQSTLQLPDGGALDTVRYTLSSKESILDVRFQIQNGIVRSCGLTETHGFIIKDKQYPTLLETVTGFLEKYQNYTKINSTDLVDMLDNVDLSKNVTITNEKIRLEISNVFWAGMDLTQIDWTYIIDGADYALLQLSFQKNGTLESFRDTRAIYTVGDTSISVSEEYAVEIALKNLSTYSYKMPDQSIVSDFNVTEDKIVAKLATSSQNLVLRPYWDIRMPLNQTYPGNVQGITAFIWANTGEIFSYSNIAYGGIDSEATPSPDASASLAPSEAVAPSPLDLHLVALPLALATIATVLIAIMVFVKRKQR